MTLNPEQGADEANLRYEGWRVVASSVVGVFLASASLFTFAVLLRPLSVEFSWSRQAISVAYACLTLASAFAAPIVGHYGASVRCDRVR